MKVLSAVIVMIILIIFIKDVRPRSVVQMLLRFRGTSNTFYRKLVYFYQTTRRQDSHLHLDYKCN
jgi:hypothetical protein